MQEAIRYFIIVQQLMDRLPGVGIHRTMMINVSRFVDVQTNLYKRISEWLTNNLIPQIRKNANYPDNAKSEDSGEFHQLKLVWDEFDLETLSGLTWKEFSPELLIHLSDLRVAVVNNGKESQKGNGLNYDANPNGDRVIAVGGQCLSRGLTLEGLVVSYFYRNSAAYDTLLQMGRWFGYRPHYDDLVKIWLSSKAIDWYGQITRATEELKAQIIEMRNEHRTPREFGLKVRQDPGSLMVTARNKMRGAKPVRIPVSVSGHLLETPRLKANPRKDHRHILNHCQFCRPDQVDAIAEMGFVPSYFVTHTWFWGDIHRDMVAGPERAAHISPLKAALNKGITFALHNDTPVTPISPLMDVFSAVTRLTSSGKVLGPDQRITVMEALRGVTINGAYMQRLEDKIGSLEKGKLADLVILDKDPTKVAPETLKDIKVDETIVGGQTVYKRA